MDRVLKILPQITLAGATADVLSGVHNLPRDAKSIEVQAAFVRAAGGTDVTIFVQISIDGGTKWIDIMCFMFTTTTADKVAKVKRSTALAVITPKDGTLADNTIQDGLLGSLLRTKRTTTGTYSGISTLELTAVIEQ